jgi:hypothetical protein
MNDPRIKPLPGFPQDHFCSPWPGTLRRWRREGLLADASYEGFFDVDKVARIEVDNSP